MVSWQCSGVAMSGSRVWVSLVITYKFSLRIIAVPLSNLRLSSLFPFRLLGDRQTSIARRAILVCLDARHTGSKTLSFMLFPRAGWSVHALSTSLHTMFVWFLCKFNRRTLSAPLATVLVEAGDLLTNLCCYGTSNNSGYR